LARRVCRQWSNAIILTEPAAYPVQTLKQEAGAGSADSLPFHATVPELPSGAAKRVEMTALKFYKCALLAVLGLTSQAMSTVGAQDRAGMTPFVGETAAEFEARKKGLPPPTPVIEPSTVTLDADARGHFGVDPAINGTHVRMMVDTGASSVVLTGRDARTIGINPPSRDFALKMSTVNGIVLVAPVLLEEVAVGDIVVRDVRAVVLPEDKLQVSLLGMSFLSKLSRFEVSGAQLVLTR